MPELPEVETTVRAISKFQNKILKEIIVHNADLRWKVDKNISQLSKNKLIKEILKRHFKCFGKTFQRPWTRPAF